MNEIMRGPTRRKWTLAEFDRLSDLGIFAEHERIELIAGELIPMPSKGIRHERVRGIVSKWLSRRLPLEIDQYQELGWRPGNDLYLEPDLLLCRADQLPPEIPPIAVVLIVEVAKTSIEYDHGLKAEKYAALGVTDYWVINAVTMETRVHRKPTPAGYQETVDVPPTATLVPLLMPALALRLADLDFGDDVPGEDGEP